MKNSAIILCILGLAGMSAKAEMVSTPAGDRDSAGVHVLESGQTIQQRNGHFEISGGTIHHMTLQSIPMTGKVTPINDNGWITYSQWAVPSPDSITSFSSRWVVPPNPVNQDGQLLYLFNGLTNAAGNVILQPVLQWGNSPSGGGNYWAAASWYVTSDGQAFTTPPVRVQPGQVLTGVMTQTSAGNGVYSYNSQFVGVPGTTLTTVLKESLPIAYETLEAYAVVNCSDYPSGGTAFADIQLQSAKGTSQITWKAVNKVVDCGQHTNIVNSSAGSGEVDLFY